jgi:hypothetical protein
MAKTQEFHINRCARSFVKTFNKIHPSFVKRNIQLLQNDCRLPSPGGLMRVKKGHVEQKCFFDTVQFMSLRALIKSKPVWATATVWKGMNY